MAKAESKPQVNQATNTTDKAKALAAALAQIEKQFGKGSIMRLGNNDTPPDIDVVSGFARLGCCAWRGRFAARSRD